jgi:serine/threonine protein kinase
VVRSEDEELMVHTDREFNIMKVLMSHPNIVQGYALYSEPQKGRAYLVMEKITGNNILEIVTEWGAFEGKWERCISYQ